MAKKKIDDEEFGNDFFKMAAKGVGAEILEERDKNAWSFIDTGILGLNFILSGKFIGGGIPGGICLEVFGNSSSGKTLIGTNFLRGTQTAKGIPVFLDAENTLSKDFAVKASHVDPNKLIVVTSDTLEGCFNEIHKIIRWVRKDGKVPIEKPLVIVYDSIAVSPSEREFGETAVDMTTVTKTQMKELGIGADKPGERAKICSKELRKLNPILAENNATILFVNQIREKIGVMYGSNQTTAGGGRGLEFYCSMRLDMTSSKRIEDKNGKVIGINVNVKCVKNKCASPFQKLTALRLLFDKGIQPFSGLLDLMLQNGRIKSTSAGVYQIIEPWAGGKEIKFKSSKERNDIPAETLLACPALVDATDPTQIQYYIDMFGDAITATASDSEIVEVDVPPEERSE
jgi:recombination protein RecA